MWIKQLLGISSMSVCWPGYPLGSHAWILITMFQLAMDLPSCVSLAPGPEFRLQTRAVHRHRIPGSPGWNSRSVSLLRLPAPSGNPTSFHPERPHARLQASPPRSPHGPRAQRAAPLLKSPRPNLPAAATTATTIGPSPSAPPGGDTGVSPQTPGRREKRHLRGGGLNNFDFRGGRPTAETEFIAWGPTGGEDDSVESSPMPRAHGPTTVSVLQTRKTTVAATTTAAAAATAAATTYGTLQTKGSTESPIPGITHKNNPKNTGRISTTEPYTSPNNGKDIKPPRTLGETSGLAVHQIITITVSLIMVIAALITTLVLKNCCAQSGNTRRHSHQRKINQQEESCQNLTDFTPARVPSNLDIFTAYNETLQCSHECVRTSMPMYPDETLHPTADYKTTFNGNRISSSDRHLIPVAFVSEKWFEISC
ncbi:adherens junction-associated protein 1 isoform X1 [Ornithorhynchus anatinus]|uniref:Adherens junctions associated protein 1 n=1 Tax=Ornithorhynchus anatinus TaxID=9258 RepID=A0A6I8PGX3_ORNAN|nr:adherens junction-associated protein 1 isoform X1 [Ornithorhynchus anatinus]